MDDKTGKDTHLPPLFPSQISKLQYDTCYSLLNRSIVNAAAIIEKENEIKRKSLDRSKLLTQKWNIGSKSFIHNNSMYLIPNIIWPSSALFTPEIGKSKIFDYITKTWQYDKCWKFCIDYLGFEECKKETDYKYRVLWSQPTIRKPIPLLTVAIYFHCYTSKVRPQSEPINVTFTIESSNMVHSPGQTIFREHWLKQVMEDKAKIRNLINF